MKKLAWILFGSALIFCLPARAQDAPKYEIGGGYAFRSFDDTIYNIRLNMNGWDAFGDYHIWRFINVAADVSGTYSFYGTNPNSISYTGNTSIYNVLAGPQLYPFGHNHKITFYGHLLFGEGMYVYNLPSEGGFHAVHHFDSGLTWMGGGGFDVRVTKHWSVRLPEADYEQTHFFGGGAGINQGNYRVSVGAIYRFGAK